MKKKVHNKNILHQIFSGENAYKVLENKKLSIMNYRQNTKKSIVLFPVLKRENLFFETLDICIFLNMNDVSLLYYSYLVLSW